MKQDNSPDAIYDLSEIFDVLDIVVWKMMKKYDYELILEALSVKAGEVLKYNQVAPESVSEFILGYIQDSYQNARWVKE